jgi:hypothetical protein
MRLTRSIEFGIASSTRVLLAVTAALVFSSAPAWAGPPFQTDDPEPVDFRHYEFYQFGQLSSTPVETDPTGPALEFNWGVVPNVQLHAIFGWGGAIPSNSAVYAPAGIGPSAYGLADTELGAKIRFIKQTKRMPEIGSFTMLELPTGSSAKGLGVGRVWYRLPVWVQKDWGEWTTYGGAGYTLIHQTQYSSFPYAGWLLQRNIGKKWTLGGEVFWHAHEGLATPQTQASTLVDLGGYYYIKNPGLQILFAYGHSVFGQTENYAYLGLYQTWGKNKGSAKDSSNNGENGGHGLLSRMLAGR